MIRFFGVTSISMQLVTRKLKSRAILSSQPGNFHDYSDVMDKTIVCMDKQRLSNWMKFVKLNLRDAG
jgi:hypothetical protein